MALNKYKIGKLIEQYKKKCGISNLSPYDVSGINREKEFFEPSNQIGSDTSNYKEVPTNYFACNLMHVGRDVVLPIAFNNTDRTKYVSPAYTIFKIIDNNIILNEYLIMLLKSSEKDRLFWLHTDASVRDGMSYEDFCDIELELPPISIQKKYVNIYKAMVKNQKNYAIGLDDLKLTCDAYIENVRKVNKCEEIGKYIKRYDEKNINNLIKKVKGVSVTKELRDPTSKVNKNELSGYKIVHPGDITFVQTTHNEKVFAYAINNTGEDIVVTSVNEVFQTNSEKLIPEFLALFFNRTEFDRYARFHSWGSARETFTWNDLIKVKLPIPDINIQKSIVEIYNVYKLRKELNEQLKNQIKNICPILVNGAIIEARM